MIPLDTAPPPSIVRAVCTVSVPREIPTTLPCIAVSVQEGKSAGLGFVLSKTISVQFFGVLEPDTGHLIVTHVAFGDGDPEPVIPQSGCDVLGDTLSCYTPGLMISAVVQ